MRLAVTLALVAALLLLALWLLPAEDASRRYPYLGPTPVSGPAPVAGMWPA